MNKRREDFKNLHRTLRGGDTREDGMVFLGYQIGSKDFETWVSKNRYNKEVKRLQDYNKTQERRDYARRYERKRRGECSLHRIRGHVRHRVWLALDSKGYKRKSKTEETLGCSYEEFYKHFEDQFTDGMSWDRLDEIHHDHVLPLSAANTEEELMALAHHRNIQPLWAKDNLIKGDKYCPKELKKYLTKYL